MSDNVSYELQQIRQILERIADTPPVAPVVPDVNVTVEGGGGGVSDGDKGALTVAGDVWTLNPRVVTATEFFAIDQAHLVGRHGSGTGDVQPIGITGGLELSGSNMRRAALTGDVTAAAGSNALAITPAANPAWVTSLAWAKLTGVPSTFAPSAHTHALSELLQSGATLNQVVRWNGTTWVPATIASSRMVNYWVATTTTTGSTTNILPMDDTIPQSGEGAEFITVTGVTPSSAANKLKVTVSGWYRVSGASIVGCALFVGSAANAAAARPLVSSNAVVTPFDLVFWIDAFSGTETLRFRMGTDRNTVTLQFLNSSSAVYFGATDPAMILVEEYAV